MSPACQLLAELLEILRAFERRISGVAASLGCENISAFDEELERLRDVVFDLSGATAKRNEYHDSLVRQGAANIGWNCLESLGDIYVEDKPTDEFAQWLLDYAAGTLFGNVDNVVRDWDDEHSSHDELVEQYGLLRPRPAGDQ